MGGNQSGVQRCCLCWATSLPWFGSEADAALRRLWQTLHLLNLLGQNGDHGAVALLARLEFLDPCGQGLVASQHVAHADEGANNQDVHLDRAFAAQYGGEHGDTMLGESKGQVTAAAPT